MLSCADTCENGYMCLVNRIMLKMKREISRLSSLSENEKNKNRRLLIVVDTIAKELILDFFLTQTNLLKK